MTIAMVVLALTAGADRVNPLDAFVAWSRGELQNAGLTRHAAGGSVYWTGGAAKGKTLVLLHGVNDQAGTWSQVVPLLKSENRLIIPDLAGHGESEPKTGPTTFAAMLAGLDAVLQRETDGKVTLVGNSMGGWIAMLYALEHPDKVERLVLEDSSGIAWDLTKVPLAPKNREEAAVMMRAVYGPHSNTPDDVLDALVARKDPPIARIALPDVLQHLVDARLKELTVPVTLVWGRDDGILTLDYAKALQAKIKGATLSVIDGAAHIPHRQQPARFVECLKANF